MDRKPTIQDTYTLIKVLEERIEGFIFTIRELRQDFLAHCRKGMQFWTFAIPTLLILAQFLYLIIRGVQH
jgi:hypothetical protein